MSELKPSIYKKMLQVKEYVLDHPLQKSGRNQAQRYDYVTSEDVATLFARAETQVGLVSSFSVVAHELIPTMSGGKPSRDNPGYAKVVVEACLFDTDTGESVKGRAIGYGLDYGDKQANKAMTVGRKYAHLNLYGLAAGGDDPEADETVDELARQPGRQSQQRPPRAAPAQPPPQPKPTGVVLPADLVKQQAAYEAAGYTTNQIVHAICELHESNGLETAKVEGLVKWLNSPNHVEQYRDQEGEYVPETLRDFLALSLAHGAPPLRCRTWTYQELEALTQLLADKREADGHAAEKAT